MDNFNEIKKSKTVQFSVTLALVGILYMLIKNGKQWK